MEIDRTQKELIIKEASEDEIQKSAIDSGMKTIEENMVRAVLEHKTAFEEYLKFIKFKETEVK